MLNVVYGDSNVFFYIFMLSFIMLSTIMLSVVMLSVVAPLAHPLSYRYWT
jgi:hypothetical protein